MKAAILFIESNTSGTGQLFVEAAAEMGLKPYLLTSDESRYPYARSGPVTVKKVDTTDPDAVWQTALEIAFEQPIAGVATSSEYWLAAAADLACKLGLPGADGESLRRCRSKNWQRECLEVARLQVPIHKAARSIAELKVAVAEIPLPLIVKPAQGTGSIGVLLCRTRSEALSHGRSLLERTVNERGLRNAPEIVIESYIEGQEFSAEMFGLRLIGVTRKHLSEEPYFVETGHDHPAVLDVELLERIGDTCTTALLALGLGWGPAHIEFRLTMSGPVIIEVNPRLAGGFIPSLVRLSSGVDLIRETIALCSGSQPDLSRTCTKAASIRFVRCIEPGLLMGVDVEGLDTAHGVEEVRVYKSGPEIVSIHHDFRDRIGHVIAVGETVADSAQYVDEALRHIRLQMMALQFTR